MKLTVRLDIIMLSVTRYSMDDLTYENYQKDLKRIVEKFIRNTSPHLHYQKEDLLQEAALKFLECVKVHREGELFLPFLETCVRNHLIDYVAKEIRFNRSRKAGSKRDTVDGNVCSATGTVYIPQDEEEVFKDDLDSLIEKTKVLSTIEITVLKTYIKYKGQSLRAAESLGMIREVFFQIRKRALDKLRYELENCITQTQSETKKEI